jgi:hypothetical protein
MPAPKPCATFADNDFSAKNRQFFVEKLRSANEPHAAFMADNDELAAAFQQMKAARLDLTHKAVAPDFAFDPPNVTSHNTALSHGLGAEYRGNP